MSVPSFLPLAAALIAGLLLSTTAAALKIQRYDLNGLLAKADAVVVAEVASQTRRPGRGGIIWTDYDVVVEERLAGRDRGDSLTLSFAGQPGAGGMQLLDTPSLTVGGRYVLFLQPDRPFAVPTVGWGQGVFTLVGVAGTLLSAEGRRLERSADAISLQIGARPGEPARRAERAADPQVYDGDGTPRALSSTDTDTDRTARERQRVQPLPPATLDDLRRYVAKRRAP